MMAPGAGEVAAGNDNIPAAPEMLEPMTANEIKLLIFSVVLLAFWATEGKLHAFDSSSVAVAAVALMFMPWIGVLKWAQVQARVPWGILIQLGVGVGLGTALLKTGAAAWLASYVVTVFDVQHLSVFAILAVLWLFLIVIHLGFASGAAMATTMIPVMISMLQQAQLPPQKIAGITMLLTFVTSVGWILPINGPQNMLAYGTGTFEARDFIRVGVVLTIIAYAMLLRVRGNVLALAWLRLDIAVANETNKRSIMALRALLQNSGAAGTTADAAYLALAAGHPSGRPRAG